MQHILNFKNEYAECEGFELRNQHRKEFSTRINKVGNSWANTYWCV